MNVLTVTGRLCSDPVRKDTTAGVVCEFRLAVDGKPRLWLPAACWGRLAGTCARHLRQGRRVAVSGPLRCDQYTDRAGNPQERWFLDVRQISFLDAPDQTRDAASNVEEVPA